MDPTLLTALAFLPLLYGHDMLHEGSHALVAQATGGTVYSMHLLPYVYQGSLRFASTEFSGGNLSLTMAAPVLAESAWLLGDIIAYHFLKGNKLEAALLRADALACCCDLLFWLVGLWGHQYSDAQVFTGASGIALSTARCVGVGLGAMVIGAGLTFYW